MLKFDIKTHSGNLRNEKVEMHINENFMILL